MAPRASGANPLPLATTPGTKAPTAQTVAPIAYHPAPANAGQREVWTSGARVYSLFVAGLGDSFPGSHGLRGPARTPNPAPNGPTAPVPVGAGPGNGGDLPVPPVASPAGLPAQRRSISQTFVNAPSVTLTLRSFALSRAPEPFLLLLERPG